MVAIHEYIDIVVMPIYLGEYFYVKVVMVHIFSWNKYFF